MPNRNFMFAAMSTSERMEKVWAEGVLVFDMDLKRHFQGDTVTVGGIPASGAQFSYPTGNTRLLGDTLQLYNVTASKWHTIWIEEVNGVPLLKIATTGED